MEVQENVAVVGPAGVAKLPLATVLPTVSATDHVSVSAELACVVMVNGKVLPAANMRVPSVLGVSAVMRALPDAAVDIAGAEQLILSAAFAVTRAPAGSDVAGGGVADVVADVGADEDEDGAPLGVVPVELVEPATSLFAPAASDVPAAVPPPLEPVLAGSPEPPPPPPQPASARSSA